MAPVDQAAVGAAFQVYLAQLAKYPFLRPGSELPSPIPVDLLLTFGDFVVKYQLEAIAFTISSFMGGWGHPINVPTFYVMKYFDATTVQALLGHFLTTIAHNNQHIYTKAAAYLGSDAFVSSTFYAIQRNIKLPNNTVIPVAVIANTPAGPKFIIAKKLVMAIPPKIENLSPLNMDLNNSDKALFGQFSNSYYWTGIVRNSGVLSNTSFANVNPAGQYGIPSPPSTIAILASGARDLHEVFYNSATSLSDDAVKDNILADIAKLVTAGGFPAGARPQFVAFQNHQPFQLTVPTSAIAGGSYTNLSMIQGKTNTWWTGATWAAHSSSLIWDFTERKIIPAITA